MAVPTYGYSYSSPAPRSGGCTAASCCYNCAMPNTGYKYITVTAQELRQTPVDPDEPDLGFVEEPLLLVQIFKLLDTEFAGPNGEGLDKSDPERERRWPATSPTLEIDVKTWLNTQYAELAERDELLERRAQLELELQQWGDGLPGNYP